jgi:predicted DNA binding CopG/RHH family protein
MTKRRNYEDLGDVELPADIAARAAVAIAQADREIEASRVNFRWGPAQVEVVKRAAQLAGVPYQTYIKQVVWRQAVEDIKDAASIGLTRESPAP